VYFQNTTKNEHDSLSSDLKRKSVGYTLTMLVDYIIEKEPLVNKFISVPKDKGKC